MKSEKFFIEITALPAMEEQYEGYEKVCEYLLRKICEDCEVNESIGLPKGING